MNLYWIQFKHGTCVDLELRKNPSHCKKKGRWREIGSCQLFISSQSSVKVPLYGFSSVLCLHLGPHNFSHDIVTNSMSEWWRVRFIEGATLLRRSFFLFTTELLLSMLCPKSFCAIFRKLTYTKIWKYSLGNAFRSN